MKAKKSKQIHRGEPVYYDENGKMFVESGNTRLYFNQEKTKEIEARKRKK